jgi:tellurite methyltransferase
VKNIMHNRENMEPSEFLVENISLLPGGKALDVAMGSGRNAIYLAQRGYDVAGVDISQDNINSALKTAIRLGVSLRAQVADLEKYYSIKKDTYDVIVCFNYLQRSLIFQIKEGVRIGGMVVYETYIIDQAHLFGKPQNPDYLLQHNELLDMFRDFRCLRYREGVIDNQKAIASIIAQRTNRQAPL